jgi:chemotaxis protein methyltransferase CheR
VIVDLPGLPPIGEGEFALFQALIRRESGIALGPHKKPLLVSRLFARLRALGFRSFAEYYRHVTRAEGGPELVRMIDCICTNETHFFREPVQFELLQRVLIPAWIRSGRRQIRAWSAACSTGEEPYSVAMEMLYHLPSRGFSVEVVASDLSTRVLEHAERAVWPLERAAEIPDEYLHAFMLQGKGAEQRNMKVGPEIRRLVHFRRYNLTGDALPRFGFFDLILCRNVLIYFDAETRAAVVERLLDSLYPGGYLFLGHAEGLGGATDRVETIIPAVYRRKPPPGAGASTAWRDEREQKSR